jgi:hypothetical protein
MPDGVIEVKVEALPIIYCKVCGTGDIFVPIEKKRYVSRLVSPRGTPGIFTEEISMCLNCFLNGKMTTYTAAGLIKLMEGGDNAPD